MRIERHVFGSFSGYTTLAASTGITADDRRLLEGTAYGFGQTEDRRFLKSLRTTPAYFTRALRSSRRGLTRVFEGQPDDNGRATLCMITAVISQREWDRELCSDVALLLRDDALWDWTPDQPLLAVERSYPTPNTSLSTRAVRNVAALISHIEHRWGQGQTVVSADEFTAEQMRAVEMLIPSSVRSQFTSGYRTLSPQLGVTLNGLDGSAAIQKISFQCDGNDERSPYVTFLLEHGLGSGTLPVAEAMTYRGFGAAPRPSLNPTSTYVPPPPVPEMGERRRIPISGVVAIVLISLCIGFMMGLQYGRRRVATSVGGIGSTTTAPSPAHQATSQGQISPPPPITTVPSVTPSPAAQPPESGLSITPASVDAGAPAPGVPHATSQPSPTGTGEATGTGSAVPIDVAKTPVATAPSSMPSAPTVTVKRVPGVVSTPIATPGIVSNPATTQVAESPHSAAETTRLVKEFADARKDFDALSSSIKKNREFLLVQNKIRVGRLKDFVSSAAATEPEAKEWAEKHKERITKLNQIVLMSEALELQLSRYPATPSKQKNERYKQLTAQRDELDRAVKEAESCWNNAFEGCPDAKSLVSRANNVKAPPVP